MIDVDATYREHAAWIASVTRRNAPFVNPDTIDDALQFAWLQATKHQARLDPGQNVRAWIVRVATNEALRLHQRHAQRETTGRDTDAAELIANTIPDRDRLDDHLASRELVAAALATCKNDRQARVLVLHLAGYSYHEIAQTLGISWTAVNKALQKLRERRHTIPR